MHICPLSSIHNRVLILRCTSYFGPGVYGPAEGRWILAPHRTLRLGEQWSHSVELHETLYPDLIRWSAELFHLDSHLFKCRFPLNLVAILVIRKRSNEVYQHNNLRIPFVEGSSVTGQCDPSFTC